MIGTSLNQYHITGSLGAGGMGEVYRARDTRLERDVAVKVLPKSFTAHADRMRRFEQEAKTLAALNHPNILTIHDAGEHEGAPFLVSELLEGGTLREEIDRGPLPVRKAVDYALQVADGLAAAHAKGIIHRDLKPENVFVTRDARVKILDYGLAKLRDDPDMGQGSTVCVGQGAAGHTTKPGLVLGTPAYMAPEQARGEPAEHRSDIFALGCVLHEMLSGMPLFRRDTPVESMSAILNEEPAEFGATRADVPLSLERVVQRCLEKRADDRFQSAKDLAFAVENASTASGTSQREPALSTDRVRFSLRRTLPWGVAGFCLAALALSLLSRGREAALDGSGPSAAPVRQFELTLPAPSRRPSHDEGIRPVLSPDGSKLAYGDADGLWMRWLDRIAPPQLLVGDADIAEPFWSPQGTDLGYFVGRKLYRIAISGGVPVLVGTAPEIVRRRVGGGAWLGDRIVFVTGSGASGLVGVPAEGGKVGTVHALAEGEGDFHNASALPHDRGVLFVVHRTVGFDTIAVWSPGRQRKVLLQIPRVSLYRPVYATTGHVLFERGDESRGIWAFPFSLEKLERTGEAFRVSDVGMEPSTASDGTLTFSLETEDRFASRQLVWVDRSSGIPHPIGAPMPGLIGPRVSPDGRRAVVMAGEASDLLDIWLIDTDAGGAIPFSTHQAREYDPRWSRDGRSIVFVRAAESGFRVLSRSVDGSEPETVLFEGAGRISGGGKYLLISEKSGTYNSKIVGYAALEESPPKVVALPDAFQRIHHPELSPDDRLLAYQSEESGQFEVYVVDFPSLSSKAIVSRGGGYSPRWSPDGSELFYLSSDGRTLMSGRLGTDRASTAEPSKVIELPPGAHAGFPWDRNAYDVASDGRFLMLREDSDETSTGVVAKPSVRVILNWLEAYRGTAGK